MEIWIKRKEYTITKEDEFMDNGACVQLLTQSKERSEWGHRANPVLSKKAIKQIDKYDRIGTNNNYTTNPQTFTLDLKEQPTDK